MNVKENIFKAYDIRGIYPTEINEDIAYQIGQGYAAFLKPEGEVLVGCDVRLYSPALKAKVIEGLVDAGVDVVDVGLISTEMCYYGVGKHGLAGGIQVTASHNPSEYHGAKMVGKGVVPLTGDWGIPQIKEFVLSGQTIKSEKKGEVRVLDLLDEFCEFALGWLKGTNFKSMKVVYNPNFGFEGKVFERLAMLGKLPLEIIPLNAQPDGHFPKGRPDPFIPENRVEFSELVRSSGADLGVTWDADADRVFFCADGGIFLEPYYLNTVLIHEMLATFPRETVIYDPRYTWALVDAITQSGGKAEVVRVGHSFIKTAMRASNALFAAESSGHTYYRDFWFADSGMLPLMQVLNYLNKNEKPLSESMQSVMQTYYISGEINQKVEGAAVILEKLESTYKDAQISKIDGLSIEYTDWRFNVRTSNTEPLLRLNLEAKSKELMEKKRDEVLALMKS